MRYNPLSHSDRIERANLLADNIIVKALQSDRGGKIRVMNVADHKKMIKSVFNAVYNQLAVESQLAYAYECDKYVLERDGIASDHTAEFKPMSDVEIEEAVSAYFEIDGKLQYREVTIDSIGKNIGENIGKAIGKAIGKKASQKTLTHREFFENNYKEMARGTYKGVIALADENGIPVKDSTAKNWLKRATTRVAEESA